MRKATNYKVSGVLDTKPTNLPEGLQVEEIEVTLPCMTLDIIPVHGGSGMRIAEYDLDNTSFASPGVMLGSKGIYDGVEVRKLRDFLNTILDEPFPMRVMRDSTGDFWFELEPNLFTYGSGLSDVGSLEEAKRCLADPDDSFYVSWTLEKMRARYYDVVDVTYSWNWGS